MPVIRASDIVDIMATGTQPDEQAMAAFRDMALRVTSDIRKLAEPVVCFVEDMERADNRVDLLRLRDLTPLHSAQALNTEFHNSMAKPLYRWASAKGFSIERDILSCNVLWLQSGGIRCPLDMVVIVIFVPRPRRRDGEMTGEVAGDDAQGATAGIGRIAVSQEPPSKGSIKSPIGGSITATSPFECQVGDMIVLAAKEQIYVREKASVKEGTGPRDICMFCIMHRTTPTGAAGEGAREAA